MTHMTDEQWSKCRRPDESINLIMAYQVHFKAPVMISRQFLHRVEGCWPIRSRQAAAMVLAVARSMEVQEGSNGDL